MKHKSFAQNINLKSILIAFLSLFIIFYSSVLIVNTINNGIKRYNLIEGEEAKLDKLKIENKDLQNQLSHINNFEDKAKQALDNFNLIDPEARIYIVQIPQEIKYLDVKSEINSYIKPETRKSGIEKFINDLFGH